MRVKETPEFLALVEKLAQSKLGEQIINTLDLSALLKEIVKMVSNIISGQAELESEDRLIIDFGLSILVSIVLFEEKCRSLFMQSKQ